MVISSGDILSRRRCDAYRAPSVDTSNATMRAFAPEPGCYQTSRGSFDGRSISHLRGRGVSLLGQGSLLVPLQGDTASMDPPRRFEPGGVSKVREASDHPAGSDPIQRGLSGFHADYRTPRGFAPRTVDSSLRSRRPLRFDPARGI